VESDRRRRLGDGQLDLLDAVETPLLEVDVDADVVANGPNVRRQAEVAVTHA
jgi:hypothetical protein